MNKSKTIFWLFWYRLIMTWSFYMRQYVVLKIKELHRICYDYFLREHEKNLSDFFFSHRWFCCSKVKLCTYVLWYSDSFSKYVVKRVFTFSLTARHLVKAHQFQLCICYVKSVPNNRFSWILSPICVKNMYLVSK